MTLPIERTTAVIRTQRFLIDLLDSKKTPRVPLSVRKQALSLLRHYPTESEMNMIADREDDKEVAAFHMKIFGKGYI
jgi:hypothetical protein